MISLEYKSWCFYSSVEDNGDEDEDETSFASVCINIVGNRWVCKIATAVANALKAKNCFWKATLYKPFLRGDKENIISCWLPYMVSQNQVPQLEVSKKVSTCYHKTKAPQLEVSKKLSTW